MTYALRIAYQHEVYYRMSVRINETIITPSGPNVAVQTGARITIMDVWCGEGVQVTSVHAPDFFKSCFEYKRIRELLICNAPFVFVDRDQNTALAMRYIVKEGRGAVRAWRWFGGWYVWVDSARLPVQFAEGNRVFLVC